MADIRDITGQKIEVGDIVAFPRGCHNHMQIARVNCIQETTTLERVTEPGYQWTPAAPTPKFVRVPRTTFRLRVTYPVNPNSPFSYRRDRGSYVRRINRLVKLDKTRFDDNLQLIPNTP